MRRLSVLAIIGFAASLTASAGQAPEQQSWTVLDKASRAGDFAVRQRAVAALETIGAQNPEAVQRLVVIFQKDGDSRVQSAAALALGRMKARQAAPALRAALPKDHGVGVAAAEALMEMGDPAGREVLVQVLDGKRSDTPGIMTNAKREAERRIRHPQGLAIMGAEDAAGTVFPPAGIGIAAVKNTTKLISKDSPGRVAAVDAMIKDPDPYSVRLLEWALGDSSSSVRAEAAKGLGTRGTPASIDRLTGLLDDHHSVVRTMAAASIIRLSHPSDASTVPSSVAQVSMRH